MNDKLMGFMVGFLLMFTPSSALDIVEHNTTMSWDTVGLFAADAMHLVGLVSTIYFGYKIMMAGWKGTK